MSETSSLYEQVLASFGTEGSNPFTPPSKPPRPSGAVALWRRNADAEIEVYWVQRSESLRFMGGWHAFPGGAQSRRDAELSVDGSVRDVDRAPRLAAMPEGLLRGVELEPILTPGLLAAALRELFEEIGLLLTAQPVESAAAARREILSGDLDAHDWFIENDLRFEVSRLGYAGRWLTPPLGPVRFDNRFFLLEWPREQAQQPHVIPGELAHGEWIVAREALARWDRSEVFLAPPIVHILRVLANEGPEDGWERLAEPVEANVGPFRRVEFRPGVLLFPLSTPTLPPATHTNTYVVGRRNAVLVDPGTPFEDELDDLVSALKHLEREGLEITEIWLTHHHPDHVGGVERIRRALNVPVCAHEHTAEALSPRGIEVDQLLSHGDRRELGDADDPYPLSVHDAPGHARGHLAFFDERYGSLICGDVVAGVGTIVVDPPGGNMADYLRTLERLRNLKPRALFPAHGPTIRDAAGKLDEYLKHRMWREDRVLAAWKAGVQEPAEMVESVYDDVPAVAHPLATRQIVAHLDHLRSRGEIEP